MHALLSRYPARLLSSAAVILVVAVAGVRAQPKHVAPLDCKKLVMMSDAIAVGGDSLKEIDHSDVHHEFRIHKGRGPAVMRIVIVSTGKEGYEGGLKAAQHAAKGIKVGDSTYTGSYAEENKYGSRSYLEKMWNGEIIIGFLKGDWHVVIHAEPRLGNPAKVESIARDMAAKIASRMP